MNDDRQLYTEPPTKPALSVPMILGLICLAVFLGMIVVLSSTLPTWKNEPSFQGVF